MLLYNSLTASCSCHTPLKFLYVVQRCVDLKQSAQTMCALQCQPTHPVTQEVTSMPLQVHCIADHTIVSCWQVMCACLCSCRLRIAFSMQLIVGVDKPATQVECAQYLSHPMQAQIAPVTPQVRRSLSTLNACCLQPCHIVAGAALCSTVVVMHGPITRPAQT